MNNKNLKEIDLRQSGQAFVSGIIFLLLTMLCSVYFLFMSESYFRNYSNIQKAREQILRESSSVANLINQLAMNNQLILQSISVAENAYAEAAEIGLYIGFTQPYWETYGALNLEKSFVSNSILSKKSKSSLQLIYLNLRNKSARGLVLAKSLSKKNKKIVEKMPTKIAKYFSPSSNSEVFCFALESQKKYYQKPGFHQIPIYENLYHFYLEKEGCKLKHTRGLLGGINFRLPLLSSSGFNEVISYKSFDFILRNDTYGIWYVDRTQLKYFLLSLYFDSEEDVKENSKFTIITKYIAKLKYFKDIDINNKEILSGFSRNIKTRVIHPYFYCGNNKNNFGDFITEEDFMES